MNQTRCLYAQNESLSERQRWWNSTIWSSRIPAYILLSIALGASALTAQTRFQIYDTIPALSQYRSVEACLAAVGRVSDSVKTMHLEEKESLPFRTGAGRDSLPSVVVAVAEQCVASFNPDSVTLTGAVETYTDWMRLYLSANRDEDAAVVARRRIAMPHPNSDTLYHVLSQIMQIYGGARPVRWDKVQETVLRFEAPGVASDSFKLFSVYDFVFRIASTLEDTASMTKMAERMISLGAYFPPDLKEAALFRSKVGPRLLFLENFLTRAARMDSLRHGPDAYIAIERANWEKTTKFFMFPMPAGIGEYALPLAAEFWFSSKDSPVASASDHPRPAKGKISLVVFLYQGCYKLTPSFSGQVDRAAFNGRCWVPYAILRRLGERYPSLEITLVARTSGYSVNTGPMSPPEEASILQKWWLGFHRLPATLAVANTSFFRLEGIDRRRIDEAVPNDVNYSFGQGPGPSVVPRAQVYLIDTNGMIIHSNSLIPASTEQTLTEMLDVMVQRGK